MTVFLHAPNVHQGGGKRLVLCLLGALDRPVVAHLDERLSEVPCLPEGSRVRRVKPSPGGRLVAEYWLRTEPEPTDQVLCFGNLPPLFGSPARVSLLLQNVYLVSEVALAGLPLRTRLRLQIERLWLRYRLGSARVIVQTRSMGEHVRSRLRKTAIVWPFWAPLPIAAGTDRLSGSRTYDFLYVASGEAHKNHLNLFEAWEILARNGLSPTLCVTLPPDQSPQLHARLARAVAAGARICNRICSSAEEMTQLYADARRAIYPSLFESFGLPLLEARAAGLPLIASDLPYVRDVVTPEDCFDPNAPSSIAAAVRRALARDISIASDDPVPWPMGPEQFISQVFGDIRK